MKNTKSFAVIGAGNGGKAMAAHLSLMGNRVFLYNRTLEHIKAIKTQGGINLESPQGWPSGFAKLALATSNIAEVLREAEIIMIVVPAYAHAELAQKMAAHLNNGQMIILHPGRTFGALEFSKVLKDQNCEKDVTIAEAETLVYISRSKGPESVKIFRFKETVPLAAFPSTKTKSVLDALQGSYPQFVDGNNVLETGLNNVGAMLHPALALLNAGRIESTKGDFEFYIDGMTPSVAKIVEVVDNERMAVANSLGIRVRSVKEWLQTSYKVNGNNLHDCIHKQTGYFGLKAPRSLSHHYVSNDVPTGLVPMVSLASVNGIPVPGMISLINIASIMNHTDYWQIGRNLNTLGLAGLSTEELVRYVSTGNKTGSS